MSKCYGKVSGYGEKEYAGCLKIELPLLEKEKRSIEHIPYQSIHMGKDHGMLLLPEINDFVVVELDEQGCAMYCTSSLFTSNNELLKKINVHNDLKIFKTRSGHEIIFNDQEETLQIQTKDKNAIKLDNKKGKIEVSAKSEVSLLQGKSKISIHEDSIEIKADKKITIDCGKGKITLLKDGTLQLEAIKIVIKSKTQIDIDSKNLNMKAIMTNFK